MILPGHETGFADEHERVGDAGGKLLCVDVIAMIGKQSGLRTLDQKLGSNPPSMHDSSSDLVLSCRCHRFRQSKWFLHMRPSPLLSVPGVHVLNSRSLLKKFVHSSSAMLFSSAGATPTTSNPSATPIVRNFRPIALASAASFVLQLHGLDWFRSRFVNAESKIPMITSALVSMGAVSKDGGMRPGT